ncbi:hypothetical protein Tco_0877822 [Tanacetum coccineum]|uniref:Uncharacterized protein n=1 Tax=Tanacetum coccineum TaxID=301880 RepID=A0ABQ5BW78_9ASTR
MESSTSNSKERSFNRRKDGSQNKAIIQLPDWVEQLETHFMISISLIRLMLVDAFKPAFCSFFGEEHQTFKLNECIHNRINVKVLENLDTLEAVIHRVVNTYCVLRMKENELNALKENGSQKQWTKARSKNTSSSSWSYTTTKLWMQNKKPVIDEEPLLRKFMLLIKNVSGTPDPEPCKEYQTGSNSGKLHIHVSLADGPNPSTDDDEFLATAYPIVAPNSQNSQLLSRRQLVTSCHQSTKNYNNRTSLPEITPFIALQLRLGIDWSKEMSEFRRTDHSANVVASIKSQVPTVVDKYLGTKLDDALLKILERHTADLIEKYSALPGPESIKNQESKKRSKGDYLESKSGTSPDASASKLHPALPSTGWKITDTRDADVDSSMHRSDPESEQSEQSSDNIPMQDEGHVSDLEDT